MKKNKKLFFGGITSLFLVLISFFLDHYFQNLILSLRLPFLNPFFIFLASSWGLITIMVILFIFLFIEKKELLPAFVLSALLAATLSYLLKYIILRPRPDLLPLIVKTSPSFPSTHAMVAFSAFFFLLQSKYTKIPALILIFLIPLSVLYTGVHYLSDVLGGIVFGIAVSYLVDYWWKKRITTHLDKPL